MANNIQERVTIDEVVNKYQECLCNLSRTARQLGVSRRALINWRERDTELQDALIDARRELRDNLEQTIYERATSEGGSDKLLIYILERLDKERTNREEELCYWRL